MSTENGEVDVQVIPDYENEMLGEPVPEKKTGGCGCQKNKAKKDAERFSDGSRDGSAIDWQKIGLIALGLGVCYYIWKNRGKGSVASVEVPKV
tara:strand:+ start:205 stop:483 length:279 start_codon:yes stop_codon:yes gene_type:complete